jgi:hypothetical protein
MTLPAPSLTHVCDLDVKVGQPQLVGEARHGLRRVIPIVGGTVSGPRIRGSILPVGADWMTVVASGVAELDARYLIVTDDGATIEVVDAGVRHGPPDVMARLAAGEPVAATDYTMHGAVRLECGDPRYAWVNATLFVGTGMRSTEGVQISVFAVG